MERDQAADGHGSVWVARVRSDILSATRSAEECLRAAPLPGAQIHRARRLLKSANGLALLVADAADAARPAAARAARDLSAFRRQLGAARDLDVLCGALDLFVASLSDDLVAALRAELEEKRREHGAAREGHHADNAALRQELNWLSNEVSRWSLVGAEPEGLLAALTNSYRKARRRGEAAFASRAPADLHDLRKAAIVHREQLLCLCLIWPKQIRAWCAEAQNLRDALGTSNDLSMLAEFVAKSALEGKDAAPLLAAIEEARAAALGQAEPTFRRLFCERPKDMARRLEAWMADPKKKPAVPVVSGPKAAPRLATTNRASRPGSPA